VKTDVEELSPTRVRLTIEVPFEELKTSLDKAYREVARQVRVPGFRPGRVPPRVITGESGGLPCWSRRSTGRARALQQGVAEATCA
jgi:hypothetical protein